ncbi:ECF transporter S component [Propioniciclava tarda]|uniref:ECF transporter S component n=1 Tax=Propioniciclava tarda TaxID=433330 RepID=A0A4Q9KHV1_PROTD|nr:ECF transporter S component [Propioniciclava tarda]TBT92177.1 ECF transporter S component [Propioniciclava tarda]SMO82083.1 energy-coupling factor transport system substrate-specific component [Propioniciclava tarda]
MTPTADAAPLAPRSVAMLAVAAVAGLTAFAWPLFARLDASSATTATFVFALVLPLVLAVVVAELTSDSLDVKGLAMLGVLAAVGAILRPLGAGSAGMEPIFFLMILGGRVFGPGFGFAQGAITLGASALLTGGVGAWLPYQMIAAGLLGLGAGLLPRRPTGGAEIAMLCGYGLVSAFAFGWLMDFAFWPFGIGPGTQFSFDPDAGPLANLHRFALYNLVTSMGWNLGRALTSIVLIVLLGPGLLHILRRASRRAAWASASRGRVVGPDASGLG